MNLASIKNRIDVVERNLPEQGLAEGLRAARDALTQMTPEQREAHLAARIGWSRSEGIA